MVRKVKSPEKVEVVKPYGVTALPPIKKVGRALKPLPGVSYLSTSAFFNNSFSRRHSFNTGNMTRRNITEHKISSNILSHNTPIAQPNFQNLNLGPQLNRGKKLSFNFTYNNESQTEESSYNFPVTGRKYSTIKESGQYFSQASKFRMDNYGMDIMNLGNHLFESQGITLKDNDADLNYIHQFKNDKAGKKSTHLSDNLKSHRSSNPDTQAPDSPNKNTNLPTSESQKILKQHNEAVIHKSTPGIKRTENEASTNHNTSQH